MSEKAESINDLPIVGWNYISTCGGLERVHFLLPDNNGDRLAPPSWRKPEEGSVVQWMPVRAHRVDKVDEELQKQLKELGGVLNNAEAPKSFAAIEVPVVTMIRTFIAIWSKVRSGDYRFEHEQRSAYDNLLTFVDRGLLTYVPPREDTDKPSTVNMGVLFLGKVIALMEMLISAEPQKSDLEDISNEKLLKIEITSLAETTPSSVSYLRNLVVKSSVDGNQKQAHELGEIAVQLERYKSLVAKLSK